MSKETVKYLEIAADIQDRKGNDYQNPNSVVRQADYYPRGCATILDIMQGKVLRMRSVLEAMENEGYNPNFESLEDSAVDLINYATFFLGYMNGEIDGQDPDRDLLNKVRK